jgi:hypothetical protein
MILFVSLHMIKRRIIYLLLFGFCMWLALTTRSHPDWFVPVMAKYGGDLLWAAQFLFVLRIIFPKVTLLKLVACNYLLGVLVEISQLWHTPILDEIRSTSPGKLLLGYGFLWSDIVCYAIGTAIAWIAVSLVEKYFSSKDPFLSNYSIIS